MKITFFCMLVFCFLSFSGFGQERIRELGINIGVIPTGSLNAITDVAGVKVGHTTLIKGDSVRTGITAILPHGGNVFQQKVPAAVYVGNGFGKLIRGQHVQVEDVISAIENATENNTEEGNVGAGTGTVAFGFKGGIGTSSRLLPEDLGGYTIGVLVQTNFGGVLEVAGVPVGKELRKFSFSNKLLNNVDGSCMIVVATDAPLDSRNLERVAKRAFLGVAKTGGIVSNGSGDYVIAFSTAEGVRIPYKIETDLLQQEVVPNDLMSPLFMAAIEATEEAILNSLFMAETMTGYKGRTIKQLPIKKVLEILRDYKAIGK